MLGIWLLAITNKSTVSTYVQVFVWIYLVISSAVELLNHMLSVSYVKCTFIRKCQYHVAFHLKKVCKFQLPHILSSTWPFSVFFNLPILVGVT